MVSSREAEIRLVGLQGIPEVRPGDHLAPLIAAAAEHIRLALADGDILVVTQKIVSKSEGRLVYLRDVEPSEFARLLAAQRRADARFIEVVLRESHRIVRMDERVIITETRHGLICANAGVDRSNIADDDCVSLLPENPDASARRLRDDLRRHPGVELGLIIADTFGRPWREGLTNVAIGLSGLTPLTDFRHRRDDHDRPLRTTLLATADELAGAAGLIMRKTMRIPAVVIRGFPFDAGECGMRELLRARERDLFRY